MTAPAASMIPEEEVREALAPHYILERELGRGGMGAVYLARDVQLERPVAIKFLPPDLAARPDLRARFLQETRTAASFSHPNIVPVHAVEERDKVLCFVMGYVDGETLGKRVQRGGPLPVSEVVRLLQESAWALSYAHGRGIVHRDVKPDNILIDRGSGRAMITDFGISRSDNIGGLTMVGEVLGTPQYMSPEQATGEVIDGRSDLYSLGVVAFYALTGRVPFDGGSVQSLLAAHITKPPPAIASLRPDLPASLSSAVDRLLEKDPARRFQTGEELAEYLDPLRASRREISPAIRLFAVKSNQIIRNSIMLLLLAPTLMNAVRGDADQMILLAIIVAAVGALSFQVVGGLRELASQGYTHEDLKTGLTAIGNEQNEARALIRTGPDWQDRQRRRRWFILGGLITAAILIFISFQVRVPRPQGGYTTGWVGLVAAALGASLLVSTWIYAIASGAGSARIDGWLRSLWTGRFGRGLYNFIASRIRTRPAVRAVSTELGAMTVFEGLSKEMRRELGDVNRVIASLLDAQGDLVQREARLESSQEEASRGTAGVATDTLERVVTELNEAKSAVVKQRDGITAELERLRLELIRLRSGVGTAAEVRAESARAKALMTSGPASATL
jgi:serine/threonine-protein kinase